MSDTFTFGGEIVWRPAPADIENANLTRFIRRYQLNDFADLLQRSTHDVAWFTRAILEFLDIQFITPPTEILDLSAGIAWPRWCLDGKLNIVANCLDKYIGTPREHQTALIWEGEEGQVRRMTYGELYRQVGQAANALRSLGLGKGDPVGLFMPMVPEIVVALLAVARIGGIILPLFSGYGAGAVQSRLADAGVRALFTADGAYRRGKTIPLKPIADEAVSTVSSLDKMIVLNRCNLPVSMTPGRDYWWHELVPQQSSDAICEPTSAEDPLMIIYTSGTSGRPKGAVHTHCSFPIKAAQDMAFGTDLHPGEVIYWITDMGWMMGPWLVFGSLLLSGTFVIYDGAPDYPEVDRVWSLVERHKITSLGLSPTFVRSIIPAGIEPVKKHDLSSLRLFASTGETWNPDPWMWLFAEVGGRVRPVINYSGGTEISGGILMGNLLFPLKPCSISAPCPGIAADVYDESGKPVRSQVGELVITAPWIGMTHGFWKDPQRYLDTYWSRWPGVWVHGDFAAIDGDGLWYILGRSDDTIKVAGKRLGPAEVESVMVSHPAVAEAAAIGVPDEIKGSAVVVFCVLAVGCSECEELRDELSAMLISALGKALAPKEVLFVKDLPKTRNAKLMRRIIRAAYLEQDLGDTSSLVNPEAIEEIHRAH